MKQPLTPERIEAAQFSLQKLAILAQALLFESGELDTDFKIPIINNFAKRIGQDALAIRKHLEKSGRFGVRYTEVTEEYSSEIWRVVTLLNGLPVENIKQFADGLSREFEAIGI